MPFVKLDTGILDSSLWSESSSTRICWITLLAMADSTGLVRATAPGISNRANLTIEETRKALALFESPDSDSRSANDEGRKIKRMDGGYQIINYSKYRQYDYTAAERMRRMRKLRGVTRNACNETVTLRKQKQKQSTDIKKKKYIKEKEDPVLLDLLSKSVDQEHAKRMVAHSKSRPRDVEEVKAFCASLGLPAADAEYLYHKWCGNGFTLNGRPIKQWKSVVQSAKAAGYLPSQKNKPKLPPQNQI